MRLSLLLLVPVVLAACNKAEPMTGAVLPGGRIATAQLLTASGAPAGRAVATEVAGGVRVTLDVRNVPAGTHGAHVHTVGRCDAPGFESAGPHWNPAASKHGTMNPQGPHAGDLPNLLVGNDGRGTLGVTLAGATLGGMLDGDGGAVVVHATADDLMTDPSGNSGGRIACGVFAPA
ncbi:MAG: superoxide dismutase family protein [Sphingomonas bacterium]|uniref:superoxide dismutase family protein n=1 Tax=Sphingomonas bacterium TaxID=1895847 RepID=UPI00260DC034|nr:superoxide dismutase family protein [Sphingomonas bacterium]MDB5696646.1 superoxide dismutase family protein [Sphingomonas bacterium]